MIVLISFREALNRTDNKKNTPTSAWLETNKNIVSNTRVEKIPKRVQHAPHMNLQESPKSHTKVHYSYIDCVFYRQYLERSLINFQ